MSKDTAMAIGWVERDIVPDGVTRVGIRRLLKSRLADLRSGRAPEDAERTQCFVEDMRSAAIAICPEKANEQHYELAPDFFGAVGPHRKYSCAYWPNGVAELADAETAALRLTCERAALRDGQSVLELGCGFGSLTLWMAKCYPRSHLTALSNSPRSACTAGARVPARAPTSMSSPRLRPGPSRPSEARRRARPSSCSTRPSRR
jgi:cyclopropane-fatty-acyl-phospholipid synthase